MYAAIDRYRDEAGRSPSTLAVATRLGLANTTFRRNFPDIVAEFAVAKTTAADSAVAADAFTALRKDNARLRLANQEHTEHLELATATHPTLKEMIGARRAAARTTASRPAADWGRKGTSWGRR
ncbi:hypothetical protein [Amycolatopsis sp. WAC 01375]|uniref:hypothetical protein n=1 Tax=Amycolatopsis sp. WAC 01375 TaxID=2203194 RepID=UPI000F7680B2|nr:hypothetical protein [Amycolatopsis sp. WAC 01375]